MSRSKELNLAEAVWEIRRTCQVHEHERPFFFMVGAGISHPPVPLAREIVESCKREARVAEAPAGLSPMQEYSWWFAQAHPSRADRQAFLRGLVKDQVVSHANLRLAHVLLTKKISNLVVTSNFDDFMSRALTLFGEQHIVCDHPATSGRIDAAKSDLQIVHVHGTHWFYDCCNLEGEIEDRSRRPAETILSMVDFLERVLSNRSPLVIGYSGWEKDVFMTALKRRLQSPLEYNVYWFCYKRSDVESLPHDLKDSSDVSLVFPPAAGGAAGSLADGSDYAKGTGSRRPTTAAEPKEAVGERVGEPRLPACDVLDALIREFDLPAPPLTRDPLGFYAEHLRRSLPAADLLTAERDIYLIGEVVGQIERARRKLTESIQHAEQGLAIVRDALRRSQYAAAVEVARNIAPDDLAADQLRQLMEAIWMAGGRLDSDPQSQLWACELVQGCAERLLLQQPDDMATRERLARALLRKGVALWRLGRFEEEIGVWDMLVQSFGDAPEGALREQVARALVNKGITLGQMDRREEAIRVCDTLVQSFGDAPEGALREQAARALVYKAITLGQMDRREEAILVYDTLVQSFGDAPEGALREQVARALVNKGITLGQMDRREEAILVYDTLVQRFGDAPEAELRKQVARALNGIGFPLLCQAKRVWAAGDEQAARSGLLEAQQKLIAATMRDPDSPMVLGNVAYVDFLLGNKEQARALMSRAIGLGGEEIRRGELADADIHPLPQDEEFKELVRSIPAAGAA